MFNKYTKQVHYIYTTNINGFIYIWTKKVLKELAVKN